jgi:hypothetical protein
VSAAALSARKRGGEDKACCDERVGLAMRSAERIDAIEGAGKSGAVADDAGVSLHKRAQLSTRLVREDWRRGCGFRREGRLRCVIAQSGRDSVGEHHGFQQ